MVRQVLRKDFPRLGQLLSQKKTSHSNSVNTDDSNSPKNPPAPTPHFSEGQKLAGCYGLKRRIAGADETEIWLAHDEVLGKDVSLHFVPDVLIRDAAAMKELRREVKRTRQLIHPNILRVYDLVEDPDWAAISMDAFDGESLAVRFAKAGGTGCETGEMQPWVAQLCQTLEDAHKINVVHRDVSPASVFMDGEGKVFVANFGTSRSIEDAVSRISGKPGPRLAAGSPQQLDGAAATRLDDVYAVGALLFQASTGRLPFVGDDVPGQIRHIAPPTVASLRGKDAAPVPAAWEKTIAACLEKRPEARPQSAAEITRRLLATGAEKELVAAPVAAVQKKVAPAESSASVVAAASVSETGKSGRRAETKSRSEPPVAPAKLAAPMTSAKSKFAPDVYSNLAPARSRFPALGFAVAAGLIVIGAAGYYFNSQGQATQGTDPAAGLTASDPSEGSELRSVNNSIEPPATPAPSPVVETPESAPAADPVVAAATLKPSPVLAAAALVATPAPAPIPAPAAVAGDEDRAVAEKTAALEKAKQAALAAEKGRAEMTRKQQQADAAVAEAQKAVEQKNKAMGPVKKGVEEVLAQRKKLEDEQKAADLAAEQARQLAAEKARVAEAAKKAIADLESRNKEKLAAQDRADTELQALQKALADRQQSAASVAQATTDAEGLRQQHLAMIRQVEQEVEQAKLVAAESRRLREEAEAERRKLGQELAEMQKMMDRKKIEIEDRLKKLESPAAKSAVVATPTPEPLRVPEAKPVEKPAPPMPATKPVSASTPTPATPAPATPVPVAVLPKPPVAPTAPAAPAPVVIEPKPAAPAPVPDAPTPLVMKTDPEKLAYIPPPAVPKVPVPGAGAENSLGMRFVPAGDVDFCVWQTRVKDFDVFARAVNLKSSAWRGPGFKQGPDHPVVNVTWVEAVAFCKWLTDLEHKDGTLPAAQFYRLPTDLEWSKAVGLPEESGKTPEARDMGVSDVYPWGTQWPPPPNSGNYTGEETGSDVAIKGYDDGFAWTSPVGSFPPNKLGLYDMGGNVWQWCMDPWNNDSKAKVLRGASWYNGALKLSLLSSCRVHASPDSSTDNYGFRIVRVSDSAKSGRK